MHPECIEAPAIIVRYRRKLTIAMLFPEGNRRFVGCCGFKNHEFPAPRSRFLLGGFEEQRADLLPAVGLENVERDDVTNFSRPFGQDKSRDAAWDFREQAVRALRAKIDFQLGAPVGDALGKAGLVDSIEIFKISRLVRTQVDCGRCHAAAHNSRITGRISGRLEVCFLR